MSKGDKNPGWIRVAGIVPESITDGPGIRFTLFVQGCPRRCEGCHNPEALGFDGGTPMLPDEIFDRIQKNPLLSGVTFSGGEPFSQADELVPLAGRIKAAGLELAVYTGYKCEELFALFPENKGMRILFSLADVIVDGPFLLARRSLSLRYRGSRNQRILDAKKSLASGEPVPVTSERWTG